MPECECGHVAPSMDRFVDHVSDEHDILTANIDAFLTGDKQ